MSPSGWLFACKSFCFPPQVTGLLTHTGDGRRKKIAFYGLHSEQLGVTLFSGWLGCSVQQRWVMETPGFMHRCSASWKGPPCNFKLHVHLSLQKNCKTEVILFSTSFSDLLLWRVIRGTVQDRSRWMRTKYTLALFHVAPCWGWHKFPRELRQWMQHSTNFLSPNDANY